MRPPEYRRTVGQRLRMEGSNCPACKILHFPPRIVCPDCGINALTFIPFEQLADTIEAGKRREKEGGDKIR